MSCARAAGVDGDRPWREISYYVHHQGKGHVERALAISTHIDEPVIFFSSLPRPSALRPNDVWVRLSADVPTYYELADDVTDNGRMHWAPIHVAGLARRSAELLQKLAAIRPRRLVVDVSVETALLARLAGVPVILVAQPGDRADDAHQLGYGIAERIIACWDRNALTMPWLAAHAQRTHLVGAISRFDGFERPPVRESRPSGLLLAGTGGRQAPRMRSPSCDVLCRNTIGMPQAAALVGWTTCGRCWPPRTSSSPTPARAR